MKVVAAVIRNGSRFLVCRRAPHKAHSGLWEFPGGKVEVGETDAQALTREIREELNVEISIGDFIVMSSSEVNGKVIEMNTYFAGLVSDSPASSSDHDELRWVENHELLELDWPELDIPVVAALTAKN